MNDDIGDCRKPQEGPHMSTVTDPFIRLILISPTDSSSYGKLSKPWLHVGSPL